MITNVRYELTNIVISIKIDRIMAENSNKGRMNLSVYLNFFFNIMFLSFDTQIKEDVLEVIIRHFEFDISD